MSRSPNISVSEIHDYGINVHDREIFLNKHFESDSDVDTDGKMAATFLRNLRILESKSNAPIIVHQINSGGLDESGFTIYDAIKDSPCFITVIAHGVCSSMGSIIILAADLRLATKNCYFMIHEGYINTGDITQRQKQSMDDFNKKVLEKMYTIYSEKCVNAKYFQSNNVKTKEAVTNFIKKKLEKLEDWYLFPEEAKAYGFIDGIIGDEEYPTIEAVKNNGQHN